VLCAKVTEMSFKLLELLVAQNGAPVHTREIALHLRGNHWHDDTTRKAIEGLIHGLEASFKARKVKPPRDLHALLGKPKHGHYVLQMSAFAD
jgi:DNA-binding response OmpR family regulator